MSNSGSVICKNCGKEIPSDSLFCQFCGTKLDINSNSTPETNSKSIVNANEITQKTESEYKTLKQVSENIISRKEDASYDELNTLFYGILSLSEYSKSLSTQQSQNIREALYNLGRNIALYYNNTLNKPDRALEITHILLFIFCDMTFVRARTLSESLTLGKNANINSPNSHAYNAGGSYAISILDAEGHVNNDLQRIKTETPKNRSLRINALKKDFNQLCYILIRDRGLVCYCSLVKNLTDSSIKEIENPNIINPTDISCLCSSIEKHFLQVHKFSFDTLYKELKDVSPAYELDNWLLNLPAINLLASQESIDEYRSEFETIKRAYNTLPSNPQRTRETNTKYSKNDNSTPSPSSKTVKKGKKGTKILIWLLVLCLGAFLYYLFFVSNSPKPFNLSFPIQPTENISETQSSSVPVITYCKMLADGPYLKWNGVKDIKQYHIYSSTYPSNGFKEVATTTGTVIWIKDCLEGQTYYFKINAELKDGTFTNYSETTSLTITSNTSVTSSPGPVITYCKMLADSPYLKWDSVTNVKQYHIYSSTSATGDFKEITATTANVSWITDCIKGQTYYFKINAELKDGTFTDYSKTVSIQIPLDNAKTTPKPTTKPNLTAVTRPATGYVFYNKHNSTACELEITNNFNNDMYCKLVNTDDIVVKRFYVRSNTTANIPMPAGTYKLRFATGTTWYGEKDLFGINTEYSKDPKAYVFKAGEKWTVTYYSTTSATGSSDIKKIPASEF